jgi:hypothetical protein
MTELTKTKLRRVAELLVEYRVFPDAAAAFRRLHRDYPKGYPTDVWIDGVLNAADSGRLVQVDLDARGNYSWLARPGFTR